MHVIIISTASLSKQYRIVKAIYHLIPLIQFVYLDSKDLICGRKTARGVFMFR